MDWREQVERARVVAKQRAQEAAAVAKDLAERATPVAKDQAAKGRALLDQKMAERKAAAEERARWYLTATGTVHTAGYPDEESMRLGIQAAAEHGWNVQNIAHVPERRMPGMGISGALAKQAAKRVMQSDRFLVTFRKTIDASAAEIGTVTEEETPR